MKRITLFFAAIVLIIASSCSKPVNYITHNSVIILSSGDYNNRSASISKYNEDLLQSESLTYRIANGEEIDGYLQAATMNSLGVLFLVCNNPDKVIAVDAITFEKIEGDLLKGLDKPTSILAGNGNIFVANRGKDNKSFISVYNTYNYSLDKKIEVGEGVDGIVGYMYDVYACTEKGVKSYNVESWEETGFVSGEKYGKAMKICSPGNGVIYVSFEGFGIVAIDHTTKKVLNEYPIENMNEKGRFSINNSFTKIYTITTQKQGEQVESSEVIEIAIVDSAKRTLLTGANLSAINISPFSDNLFASDNNNTPEIDNVVTVLDKDGKSIANTDGGLETLGFIFYQITEKEDSKN